MTNIIIKPKTIGIFKDQYIPIDDISEDGSLKDKPEGEYNPKEDIITVKSNDPYNIRHELTHAYIDRNFNTAGYYFTFLEEFICYIVSCLYFFKYLKITKGLLTNLYGFFIWFMIISILIEFVWVGGELLNA